MKLLLAVESQDNYKEISNQSLRILGRVGYATRLVVPLKQKRKYEIAIEDANYNWYFIISKTIILTGQNIVDHAKRNGFELLVRIPDDIMPPVDKKAEERYLIALLKKIEIARVKFEKGEYKKKRTIGAGITMERI